MDEQDLRTRTNNEVCCPECELQAATQVHTYHNPSSTSSIWMHAQRIDGPKLCLGSSSWHETSFRDCPTRRRVYLLSATP